MGISVPAGTAVVFVGIFLMLGVIVPGAINAHERITSATDQREQLQLDREATSISITNTTADNGTLAIQVENDGERSIRLSEVTVIVDNRYQSAENVTIDGAQMDTDLWLPDEVATFEVETTPTDTIVVVTGNGVHDRHTIGDA